MHIHTYVTAHSWFSG